MKKSKGQAAKLSYGGHVLMENRNGLCVGILVTESAQVEHRAARSMLTRARRRLIHPKTRDADKGYRARDFVAHLREHQIRPLEDQSEPHGRRSVPRFCVDLLDPVSIRAPV